LTSPSDEAYAEGAMNRFEIQNILLGMEFDRLMREHPNLAEEIPNNADIILLVEGDEPFNQYGATVGKQQADEGQAVVYATMLNG
jgi:hypothetical protein